MFDRFEICEAYYLFFSHYHRGLGCERYARLSRMLGYYRPSDALDDREDLNEMAREIYDALVADAPDLN